MVTRLADRSATVATPDLIADRAAHPIAPRTDVLIRLRGADGAAGPSLPEQPHDCTFILNAGPETTTELLGSALALLDSQREVRRALVADTSLMPTALDEALRLESPNQFGNRQTTAAVTLRGTRTPPGTDLHRCIGRQTVTQRCSTTLTPSASIGRAEGIWDLPAARMAVSG